MDYSSVFVEQSRGVGTLKTFYEGLENLDPCDVVNNELNLKLMSCLQSIDPACIQKNKKPNYKDIDGCMDEIDKTFNDMDESEIRRKKQAAEETRISRQNYLLKKKTISKFVKKTRSMADKNRLKPQLLNVFVNER